jgi:hypothetical protein
MGKNLMSHCCCFESYGVKVRLESNSAEILKKASETAGNALLGQVTEIACNEAEQIFSFPVTDGGEVGIVQNGEEMARDGVSPRFWKFFDSLVRILVADHAPEVVFLHSGVIGWRGKAIILPGNSFYGKTTLVAELVRCGAQYYSDEYAVLDSEGLVHPFARPLSLRTDKPEITETAVEVEKLGGTSGTVPIPVGLVLFTRYEPESVPNYEFLTTGRAIMDIIAQTIAIRRNTEFAIKVLKNALTDVIIVKSPRPDAAQFARQFLEFVDNTAI